MNMNLKKSKHDFLSEFLFFILNFQPFLVRFANWAMKILNFTRESQMSRLYYSDFLKISLCPDENKILINIGCLG